MSLDLNMFLYIFIIGITEGMYLWLVASGLSLTLGVLRVVNFAHGSLYMISELPMTTTGKIKRKALKEMEVQRKFKEKL